MVERNIMLCSTRPPALSFRLPAAPPPARLPLQLLLFRHRHGFGVLRAQCEPEKPPANVGPVVRHRLRRDLRALEFDEEDVGWSAAVVAALDDRVSRCEVAADTPPKLSHLGRWQRVAEPRQLQYAGVLLARLGPAAVDRCGTPGHGRRHRQHDPPILCQRVRRLAAGVSAGRST